MFIPWIEFPRFQFGYFINFTNEFLLIKEDSIVLFFFVFLLVLVFFVIWNNLLFGGSSLEFKNVKCIIQRLFVHMSKANRNRITLSNITQSFFILNSCINFYYPVFELFREKILWITLWTHLDTFFKYFGFFWIWIFPFG